MINLLPTGEKSQIAFARRNSLLAKWCLVLVLSLAGLMSVVVIGQIIITRSTSNIAAQAAEIQTQLKLQKLDETKTRVTEISSSLKLVLQVLSRQVLFSQLIKKVGTITPSGAALTSLNILKVEGGIELQFAVKDYQTGTQVQINLQDPNNGIFEKADILNINCGATGSAVDPRYPCTVSIRALFNKKNPFLFINKDSGSKP